MSKETILEEFDKISPEFGKWRMDRNMARAFLSKAIDQTREETIKEILSQLRLKLRNTYKAEDIADTAFLTESDLESVLNL